MTEDHPPDRELRVRAIVSVTVEVQASSVWGIKTSFDQVRHQAIADVTDYLQHNSQLTEKVKIVSEPIVRGFVMEEVR